MRLESKFKALEDKLREWDLFWEGDEVSQALENLREICIPKPYKKTQLELQEDMHDKGINIVTCGHCGSVMLHETFITANFENLKCLDCGFESDPSDFPDLNYEEKEWDLIDSRTTLI